MFDTASDAANPGFSRTRAVRLARFAIVDGTLQKLKRCREQVTPALARSAAAFVECKGWKFMGASCLSDHSRERFQRTSHWVRDLAAIGRGLERLPGLNAAIAGRDVAVGTAPVHGPGAASPATPKPLGRSNAARLARVATEDSFPTWLALARSSSAREFAQAVRAAREAGSEFPLADGSTGSTNCSSVQNALSRSNRSTPERGLGFDGASAGCSSPGGTAKGATDPGANSHAGEQVKTPVAGGPVGVHGPDGPDGQGGHDRANGRNDADHMDTDDADGDRKDIGIFVPGSVRLAFDDVLELHRAVCGGQVPVGDLVEALIAEAESGVVPVDADAVSSMDGLDCYGLRRGPSRRQVERRLAEIAGNWSFLDRGDAGDGGSDPLRRSKADRILDDTCRDVLDDANDTCSRLAAIAGRAGQGPADELDKQIRELLLLDDRVERGIGQLLGWISAFRACWENMFSGVGHYGEERLGMSRREAQLRARVDRRLRQFPRLFSAYERGDLGLEAANVLLRILDAGPVEPAVEQAWLAHATSVSVKRLRDEARMARRGWLQDLEQPGPPLPAGDDAWFRSLARFPGTTRRRLDGLVADTRPQGRRGDVTTLLSLRLPAELADRFAAVIQDRCRQAHRGLPSAPAASRLAKMSSGPSGDVPAWVGLLALMEEYVATWDDPAAHPDRRFGRIYSIWGWRCAAPGCTRRCHLEAHHLQYLSHGGPDAMWNLVVLCAFHHRQGEHGYLASCRGRGPLNIVWRLGHRRSGRWYRNERELRRARGKAAGVAA